MWDKHRRRHAARLKVCNSLRMCNFLLLLVQREFIDVVVVRMVHAVFFRSFRCWNFSFAISCFAWFFNFVFSFLLFRPKNFFFFFIFLWSLKIFLKKSLAWTFAISWSILKISHRIDCHFYAHFIYMAVWNHRRPPCAIFACYFYHFARKKGFLHVFVFAAWDENWWQRKKGSFSPFYWKSSVSRETHTDESRRFHNDSVRKFNTTWDQKRGCKVLQTFPTPFHCLLSWHQIFFRSSSSLAHYKST